MEKYTVKEIVERIEDDKINAYEVTCLPSKILLSDKVLLALMTSHTVPLEFALQNPKVIEKLKRNKIIHDVVMKSYTELYKLWNEMQQYNIGQENINYNLILEALTGELANFNPHPSNEPNIWVLYGLYPGLKQIKKMFGNKIPTVGDIKNISDEILNTTTVGGITIRQKLLNTIDRIEEIKEENSHIDYASLFDYEYESLDYYDDELEDFDDELDEDYDTFIRTRKKHY